MIPVLYDQGESLFLTNGLGRMTEATSCIVTEERNGVYELEMVYPVTGKHYQDIQTGRILTARHSDNINPQPFRIYRISRPLSGMVTVNARHISYDLCDITVLPFTASGVQGTFAAIPNNTIVQCPFTFWTDKTTANTYTMAAPRSVRAMLGGEEGSILDIFGGGDYEFDGWAVKLHNRRGSDNGVTIRYGKNLTDINRTTDAEDAYTAVVPFYVGADGTVVTLPEKMLTISGTATVSDTYTDHTGQIYTNDGGNNYTAIYTPDRILTLDLSEAWEEAPTAAQLRSKAQSYIANNLSGGPVDNIRVSFVALWQTEEYKDVAPLQRAEMGDTVKVYYPALDVNVSMRVIKTVYDCLLERYNSIELGTATYTMNSTIKGISSTVAESAAKAAAARAATSANNLVEQQTALITGQTGGYFVTDTNEAGQPIGWLLMDSPDKTTARNVIRANQSGIGFSQNGYNGPYVSAWTIDGRFNADFVQTGTLLANLIKAGILSDSAGKFYLNMQTGELVMQDGTFSGTVNAISGQIGPFTVTGNDDISIDWTYTAPGAGDTYQLSAKFRKNYNEVMSIWRDNEKVFEVDANGMVTAASIIYAGGVSMGDSSGNNSSITASDLIFMYQDNELGRLHADDTGLYLDSDSESISTTYNGLTLTLYKNAGAVTCYISGTTSAAMSTASAYVTLWTPYKTGWMPKTTLTSYQLMSGGGIYGQISPTSTAVRIGYTRNASNTAADIPANTTIRAVMTWAAK